MSYKELQEQVRQNVIHFYKNKCNEKFVYHNLSHTEAVVSNAVHIGEHYKLDEKDLFIVTTAAWFHDTGYCNGEPAGHEMRGGDLAAGFLSDRGVEQDIVNAVKDCILATRMPQNPKNLLEQIVCDADLYHFGTDDFAPRNKLMRMEAEWRMGKKISKDDWRLSTIAFMQAHHFQTDYGRNLLQAKKEENMQKLRNKLKEDGVDVPPSVKEQAVEKTTDGKQPGGNTKKQKVERPERGIETMFRISSTNHQRLSDMADNKAHIMITTTSIIISVLLSVLLRKLEDNPQLIFPTLLLLTVCVITMVFSILATRPTLPPGRFTQEEIDTRKVNLLFFGNYYKMSFDEYDVGMREMMNDRDFLYGSLTRDLYSQGIVLGKKYSLLRKGYNVFMYGIVASVFAFIVAAVFF